MTNSSRQPIKSTDAVVMAASQEITKIFNEILKNPSAKQISDPQFIEALAISLINTGKRTRDDRGIAMLQTFVYDLQDFINFEFYEKQESENKQDFINFKNQENPKSNKKSEEIKTINSPTNKVSEIILFDAKLFAKNSLLSRMGYNTTEGIYTESQRQNLLLKIFTASHLPEVTENEIPRWGSMRSAQRLYAISKFLTWLCVFQGDEKPAAREKWMADLNWLKEKFFDQSMGFTWPSIGDKKSTPRKRTPNSAFMKALTPSNALAKIVGTSPLPRTEVISKLWV